MSLSLSLLNEGAVVSERERERERERENVVVVVVLLHPESMCVCVTILPTLSIVTLPTKHTMCVCDIDIERLG